MKKEKDSPDFERKNALESISKKLFENLEEKWVEEQTIE